MEGRAVSNVPAEALSLSPTFWLWGVAIIFQTAVFSVIGTWAVSRFVNRLSADIRKEISDAVKALADADTKVAKETGDSLNAMRQHVSNVERETEKRFHAVEKKALEQRVEFLEQFVRRDSFLHVTQKIEGEVDNLAKEMREGFEKVFTKIDEIRDRKAA